MQLEVEDGCWIVDQVVMQYHSFRPVAFLWTRVRKDVLNDRSP